MIDWQRVWKDDGNAGFYGPVKIIASFLSFFYLVVISFRNWLYDKRIFKEIKLSCPVISVGNITVGGAGKTPCVIMLARLLQKNGFKPAIISRGYGGKSVKPVNIVSDGEKILLDSQSAGDEPYLIARELRSIPVITGADRIAAGKEAINQYGANLIICDDAMQHRKIFRDVNLVLLDSQDINKKNRLLPRGKLREPISELKRADAVILTRANETQQSDEKIRILIRTKEIPIFKSIHKPQGVTRADLNGLRPISEIKHKKVCAFCGIAQPDSFRKILLSAETQILSFEVFPDHHRYKKSELEKIKNKFIALHADYLMTTEKDAVRIKNYPDFLKILCVLHIEMEIIPHVRFFEEFIIKRIKNLS